MVKQGRIRHFKQSKKISFLISLQPLPLRDLKNISLSLDIFSIKTHLLCGSKASS